MAENILETYFSNCSDEEFDRDIRLSSMDIPMSDRHENLANIYQSIFGTNYSVFGRGSDLSCKDVLGGTIMKFRLMTIEQFSVLFPEFGSYRLSRLCQKDDSNNKPFFSSAQYNGKTSYYYLTDYGHKHYRSFFPDKYLDETRTPITPGSLPAPSRAVHDIRLRDVPYGFIAIKTFQQFDWFTSIPLPNYKTPAEAVKDIQSKNYLNQSRSCMKGGLVADGIILFKKTGNSVIVEQDAGTENTTVLKKKISSYGDYLNSLDNHRNVTVIFNICVPNSNKRNDKNKDSHLTTYRKIELLMEYSEIYELNTFYEKLKGWISADKPMKKTYISMKKLLDEYKQIDQNLSGNIRTLRKYVDQRIKNYQLDSITSSQSSESRRNLIKKLILEALDSTDRSDYLSTVVRNGTGLIVTNKILRSAYYLFPFESGLLSNLLEQIKKRYGSNCYMYRTTHFEVQKCYLGSFIKVKGRQDEFIVDYIVAEISDNIGNYYNAKQILKTYSPTNAHLLLLVSSEQDAIDFAKETGCVSRYCSRENILQRNADYNLTIRFLKYDPYKGPDQMLQAFLPNGNKIIQTDKL